MSGDKTGNFFEVWRGNSGFLASDPKLKILDRGSGKKVEKQTLGTLLSPTKESVIEEGEYEVTLKNAQFDDEKIRICASDPNGGSQTLQRPYHQVEAVDFYNGGTGTAGITLHINGTIYRIEVATRQKEYSEVKEAVEQIRDRVTDAQSNEGVEEDGLDKLKKLSELRDEGVISEEEFEEKKQEILDKV